MIIRGKNIGSDLTKALKSAASAARAEGVRSRVIAENMANAEVYASKPGGSPFARKTISFISKPDEDGVSIVNIGSIGTDKTPFPLLYIPDHPAADQNGYVKKSNVNTMVEVMDARHSKMNYMANVRAMQRILTMISSTLKILT